MAKTQGNVPQQLKLRVFADVNGGLKGSSLAASSHQQVAKVNSSRESSGEASAKDREIYRAIAERYFRSDI